jgi:rod shape-determining protein MreC
MYRLLEFLKQFRFLILFILLEIIAICFLAYYNSYQHSYLFNVFQEVSGNVYNRIEKAKRYFYLGRLNDSLMSENAHLNSELFSVYMKEKNIHPGFFDTNTKFRYIFIPARVINNSIDKKKNYLIINVGSSQGIDRKMAVISSRGIVGIIKSVSANYSLVLSVLNNDFRLNARIAETNDLGSIVWDGESPEMVLLKDIPNQNKIKKGNHVVVGPYSQYFPENIPVGDVVGFELDKGGGFYNIRVRLNSEIRNLMNVYVIKNMNIKEPADLEGISNNDKINN